MLHPHNIHHSKNQLFGWFLLGESSGPMGIISPKSSSSGLAAQLLPDWDIDSALVADGSAGAKAAGGVSPAVSDLDLGI